MIYTVRVYIGILLSKYPGKESKIMKKIYQEPDVELIRLVPQESITADVAEGETGVESWPW